MDTIIIKNDCKDKKIIQHITYKNYQKNRFTTKYTIYALKNPLGI